MAIFYEDTNVVRSIPARIASYSVSLLDAMKSNSMACCIISPVGALSCKPTPASICREASSTLRIHQHQLDALICSQKTKFGGAYSHSHDPADGRQNISST